MQHRSVKGGEHHGEKSARSVPHVARTTPLTMLVLSDHSFSFLTRALDLCHLVDLMNSGRSSIGNAAKSRGLDKAEQDLFA